MKRLHFPVAILIVVLSSLITAQAWNKPGHMVTGAIAYYELKQRDPAALAKVINMLKASAFYQERWLPGINRLSDNDSDRHDLYLFMYAARWPDDVRGTNLHCGNCHFINYPYKPSGQPGVGTSPPAPQNIVQAFRGSANFLSQNQPIQKKANALCWIFHLVGDVHQPLHTAAIFTTTFPQGDRGGTRFYIRADEDADTISLHSFWDGLVQKRDRFNSVRDKARRLRGDNDLQRNKLSELSERDFERWAKIESFDLARRYGYLSGALVGSADEEDGAILPDNYASNSGLVAQRRAVLAGYRLADLLSDKF